MMLAAMILVPGLAGLLAWPASHAHRNAPRWIALAAMAAVLLMALLPWIETPRTVLVAGGGRWIGSLELPWIPRFGISVHLAMDGLGQAMVLLTALLGLVAVACSWTEIGERVGFFHFNLLWTLAGAIGVFLALDLFLFFFFWELMLIPMYLIIAIWGHENRIRSSIKFFLFTQGSGLVMLAAIVVLVMLHAGATGQLSFDYFDLLGTRTSPAVELLLMLGFFLAFAVKLPAVPLHTWLPDAHTDAPTGGSVILAGIMLKTGGYGLLRFVGPLFPDAAHAFAPAAMTLGVVGILYGALLAFGQTDFKRLVAYTSVSHLGFVLLGVFAWNDLGTRGAVMQMVAHGLSTSALFVIAGMLQQRLHTRDTRRMGGLWSSAPRLSGMAMLFALASLGLPGLANFVGEFLILLGAWQARPALAAIATLGFVMATVYALALVQRAFHGPSRPGDGILDLGRRELATMAALAALLVWLGVFPQPLLERLASPHPAEPAAVSLGGGG